MPGIREWFPFHIDDFWMDETVRRLEWAGIGVYLALLSHQWREGSLPGTEADIAKLLKCPPREFAPIWKVLEAKFPANGGGRRANHRLSKERAKAVEVSSKRAAIAKQMHNTDGANADT